MSYSNLAVDDFEVTNRYAEALRWSAGDLKAASAHSQATVGRFAFVRRTARRAAQLPGGLSRRLRTSGAGVPVSKLIG